MIVPNMKPARLSVPPSDLACRILYQDNHLIALNKRSGEIVQGDKTGDQPLSEALKLYIKEECRKPGKVFIGVPHRIDRPVSGIALFARTSKALERMNELFRKGEVQKTYLAIVGTKPCKPRGELKHYLVRNKKQNKTYVAASPEKDAKEARLAYRLIASSERYHLMEITLFTGRHHQIRCQLAAIGCPIKGDLKYGAPRSNPDGGICLQAHSLSFIHPVKKEKISIVAPLPPNRLWQSFLADVAAIDAENQ